MGDYGNREHIVAGGAKLDSSAQFGGAGEYTIKVNDADVNAGETSITVDALPVALPDGTELNFDGVVATLSADASAGATSITVDALAGDIANDAEASYDATADSRVVVAGTLVGRTIAERNSGDDFGPAADADDEVFIVLNDVDLDKTDDVDLVRHGSLIKTNFLPSYSGASSTLKTKLEAAYQLVLG
jgi:hypothetical protein